MKSLNRQKLKELIYLKIRITYHALARIDQRFSRKLKLGLTDDDDWRYRISERIDKYYRDMVTGYVCIWYRGIYVVGDNGWIVTYVRKKPNTFKNRLIPMSKQEVFTFWNNIDRKKEYILEIDGVLE